MWDYDGAEANMMKTYTNKHKPSQMCKQAELSIVSEAAL